MAYTKTNWVNDSVPAINATNLNKIEQGIYDNSESIDNILDSEIYSTNEVKTNKVWIDGKPIYRKVIQFSDTIQGATLFTLAHNISNVDFIFVEKFLMTETTGTTYEVPLVGYAGNITDKAYCYVNKNNLYVYSTGDWSGTWQKTAIIQYTKTTD